MNAAARCVTPLTLFSAKSKCTVSFRLMKIPLTSNKGPQNVANCLKDASKLLKAHFMFKLKVEPEVAVYAILLAIGYKNMEILHL